MTKLVLDNIAAGFAATTLINANNDAIETAIENTLSRDGTSPNEMNAPLDMNGNMILNQSNPVTVSGFNWEGPWLTATTYQVGDVVEHLNSSYIAIVEHTSGVFATDLAAAKWQIVASSAALPSQAGHAGEVISTDGSNASWVAVNTLALPITGGTVTGATTFSAALTVGITPAVDDNSTKAANTAFVIGQAAAATPLVSNPTAAVGTSTRYARADHVHPQPVITNGTAVASTSGTSIDFTGIPTWVKKITVMFSLVSTSDISPVIVQIGDSGGIETASYQSVYSSMTSPSTAYIEGSSAGYIIPGLVGASSRSGNLVLCLLDSSTNTWVASGVFSASTTVAGYCGGTKSLSATLDRLRITTAGGANTFDAGKINILYE